MGCTSSNPKRYIAGSRRKKQSIINEVAVFVPALRIPMAVDFIRPLRGLISRDVIDKLSVLRSRAVSLSEEKCLMALPRVLELQQALEEYLPILLGLTRKENCLEASVEFKWKSLEDDKESCLASAWFEVLSVVHMMAMLLLLEANLMLVPKDSQETCERKVSEDSKKDVVDLLLKAAGCLDYCVNHIIIHVPLQIRKNFPRNLQEDMLEAISIQALGQIYGDADQHLAVIQGIEMQLALALECEKATLSVKRRLACEEVSYFAQAHYCLSGCDTSDAYGKKLLSFIKWKYLEAKAVAYYYHGLILDKGSEPINHVSAVCCFCAADELLVDSKRACLSFCLAVPVTRAPPPWGVMKNLQKKVPDMACKKSQMYGYLFEEDPNGALQSLPDLPEFPLSLSPEVFELPPIDASWDSDDCQPQVQSLKEHLKDEEDEIEIQ